MHNLLIVEDDADINNLISEALKKAGYNYTQAFSGTEAKLLVEKETYDLILLDLMLPGMSGEEFIKSIKPGTQTPVIVLSAKDALDTKVDLLTLGAEDYITKPFEIKELLVRISVQLRRFSHTQPENELKYKDMILSKDTMKMIINGKGLPLTKQEFNILELLLKHPNKIFSKQDIYEYAWDEYFMGEDKTINVHISNIRQKIKKITDADYIETVWGVGFKLA